ncbi:MAG: hypothetical protein ACI9J3_001929 [Parvicellaceae bacterium]|jgi:hypothetical protein
MIQLKNIVNDTHSNASGFVFLTCLREELSKNNSAIVSLGGTGAMSTSFMNSSIGEYIETNGIEKFRSSVKFVDVTKT